MQIAASLLDLCGLPVPAGLDGESLARDLREPGRTRETSVYAEYNLNSPRPRLMLRRGQWKYCHYRGDIAELYNLTDDPSEMRNLATDLTHRETADRLRAQLAAWYPAGV